MAISQCLGSCELFDLGRGSKSDTEIITVGFGITKLMEFATERINIERVCVECKAVLTVSFRRTILHPFRSCSRHLQLAVYLGVSAIFQSAACKLVYKLPAAWPMGVVAAGMAGRRTTCHWHKETEAVRWCDACWDFHPLMVICQLRDMARKERRRKLRSFAKKKMVLLTHQKPLFSPSIHSVLLFRDTYQT